MADDKNPAEDLRNITAVMRNLFQARQQYMASTSHANEVAQRQKHVIDAKIAVGEGMAETAVSTDMDVELSAAVLDYYAWRRGILDDFAKSAGGNLTLKDNGAGDSAEDALVEASA